jgi:hypothetical protein
MTSIATGKACVNSVRVVVLVSMGRRVPHPGAAFAGRRSGYRMCSRMSLCDVASCASGSISDHGYDATAWPVFRNASSPVAIPPQSSTRCSGILGSRNSGKFASEGGLCGCRDSFLGVWMAHWEAFAELLLVGNSARVVSGGSLGVRCARAVVPSYEGRR